MPKSITIATVNNGDMVRMQTLTEDFTKKNPDIQLNWVTLEENVLRERVTTDIATKGGQYDVMTIGTYEVPIWAKQSWLLPLDDLGPDYDAADIIPAIAGGLTADGKLYAAPFYGEILLRHVPQGPDGEGRPDHARRADLGLHRRRSEEDDRPRRRRERHLPARQGRLGREHGLPDRHVQLLRRPLVRRELAAAIRSAGVEEDARDLCEVMKEAGPVGASSNGFNENLALFQQGKCGMWIDATVAASFVSDPKNSKVADKVGYALAPDTGLGKRGNWLWAWSLAVPAGTQKAEAAKKFVAWATSKAYLDLVASKEGWANVPPGTRTSLYANPDYQKAAPFAKMTLDSINSADPTHPSVKPVPYVGVQFVAIPEFAGLATNVGQLFSAALAGQKSIDDALAEAQEAATNEMGMAGYLK